MGKAGRAEERYLTLELVYHAKTIPQGYWGFHIKHGHSVIASPQLKCLITWIIKACITAVGVARGSSLDIGLKGINRR